MSFHKETNKMTNPLYSSLKITYAHSTLAGTPSDKKGTVAELEQYATKAIAAVFNNAEIQSLIGQWELVWGPAVYQVPGSAVADNAFYIAQNSANPSELVIAISGTNPISRYGWIHEDALINPLQPWPYNQNKEIEISNGTHLGLNAILTLTDATHRTTALEYLAQRTLAGEVLTITVTGHSLGGALSPAMALALHDLQGNAQSWDPRATSHIAVVPSAGPAAGNQAWADYYDACLGAATTRLWNSIDMVPHAWEVALLQQIPSLYSPAIPASWLIQGATDLAIANSKIAGDMRHECSGTAPMPGVFNPGITLTAKNSIGILETLASNRLIAKIGTANGWSAVEIAAAEAVVDELIKQLNKKSLLEKILLRELRLVMDLSAVLHHSLAAGFVSQLYDFLEFLVQAGYQHTSAYDSLVGIQAFADLASVIISELNSH
jgi:hypothetical protein